MNTINLGDSNSACNQFLAELRNQDIQTDPMRFRNNMERIGRLMAYEISKKLHYLPQDISTPLGVSEMFLLDDSVVLATVLRAGLPFHKGFLDVFDNAENAFISAYRKYEKDGAFEIQVDHVSSPDLTDKVLILVDPMLATGASLVVTIKALMEYGMPKHIHVASIIASAEGIQNLHDKVGSKRMTVWTAAIDEELTAKGYIVPGLGDAGDLAYGQK